MAMFSHHSNNSSADFYQDFSQNQQFYPVHAKLPIFLLFCQNTQNVEIKEPVVFKKCSEVSSFQKIFCFQAK